MRSSGYTEEIAGSARPFLGVSKVQNANLQRQGSLSFGCSLRIGEVLNSIASSEILKKTLAGHTQSSADRPEPCPGMFSQRSAVPRWWGEWYESIEPPQEQFSQ